MTERLPGPAGPLEVLRTGHGVPVTVVAHGVGASIAETRPYAGGVPGTRVFFHARGHGGSSAPAAGPWTYADLGADLLAVADEYAATQAIGVSLGAGALLAALAAHPDRFDRVVLALPPALDEPRADGSLRRGEELASALDAGRTDQVAKLLLAEQHPTVRADPAVTAWAAAQAARIVGTPVARALREVAAGAPLPDRSALARCRAEVLVIGQEEDELHPAAVARDVAAALPRGRLEVFGPGGLLWAHRDDLRRLVTGFLHPKSAG